MIKLLLIVVAGVVGCSAAKDSENHADAGHEAAAAPSPPGSSNDVGPSPCHPDIIYEIGDAQVTVPGYCPLRKGAERPGDPDPTIAPQAPHYEQEVP